MSDLLDFLISDSEPFFEGSNDAHFFEVLKGSGPIARRQ